MTPTTEIVERKRLPELGNAEPMRLVDVGTLQFEVSVSGAQERYRRGKTSHTVHVWWARRPHAAMRALVFASLCKDTSDEAVRAMCRLATAGDDLQHVVTDARRYLRTGAGTRLRLLDMFGGSGTIALEAARLGIDAHSLDSNELAVFIQRSNF